MTAVERVAALRQAARDSGARPAVRAVPLRTGGEAGIPDTDRPARAAYPPWCPAPALSNGDFLTFEGARRLAALIEAAWARAGHNIEVRVENVGQGKMPIFAPRMPGLSRGLIVR